MKHLIDPEKIAKILDCKWKHGIKQVCSDDPEEIDEDSYYFTFSEDEDGEEIMGLYYSKKTRIS